MSFKSSAKNKRFMVVLRLPDGPIWYPFNFFNKKDNGFTERMNNNTERYHLGKYLKDSGLYLIVCLLHDWLGEGLLTIFASKLILRVAALLLILGQSEAIRVVHY